MTKKAMYACASLLALVLAAHSGARIAVAQNSDPIVGITAAPCGGLAAVSRSGIVYANCLNAWEQKATLPGQASGIYGETSQLIHVIMENGDVYGTISQQENNWEFFYLGNVHGGSSPAQKTSLGQVKIKWR